MLFEAITHATGSSPKTGLLPNRPRHAQDRKKEISKQQAHGGATASHCARSGAKIGVKPAFRAVNCLNGVARRRYMWMSGLFISAG